MVGGLAQTIVPGLVTLLFYRAVRRPTRAYLRLLTVWVWIVILLGGVRRCPCRSSRSNPVQTLGHDLVHVAYLPSQIPVLVAVRTVGEGRWQAEAVAG